MPSKNALFDSKKNSQSRASPAEHIAVLAIEGGILARLGPRQRHGDQLVSRLIFIEGTREIDIV